MRLFPADRVRLTDGPFARALQTDRRYLLHLDPDRLLAPYLREAGLPPRAPSYGNWESSGLDGHTLGHYLSALSHLVAATGDAEAGARVRYVVDELARAQDAVGTGWVGGVPAAPRCSRPCGTRPPTQRSTRCGRSGRATNGCPGTTCTRCSRG